MIIVFIISVVVIFAFIMLIILFKKRTAAEFLEICDNGITVGKIRIELEKINYSMKNTTYNYIRGKAVGKADVFKNEKKVGYILYDSHEHTNMSVSMKDCGYSIMAENKGYIGNFFFGVQFNNKNVFIRSIDLTPFMPDWMETAGNIIADDIRAKGYTLQNPKWEDEELGTRNYMNTEWTA
ncbi:MAG: hypothetical protein LBD23_15855 [Oscillospiraceae bacterium]|nr:hypothetical protein [Oscillospiraceae bacterium]